MLSVTQVSNQYVISVIGTAHEFYEFQRYILLIQGMKNIIIATFVKKIIIIKLQTKQNVCIPFIDLIFCLS